LSDSWSAVLLEYLHRFNRQPVADLIRTAVSTQLTSALPILYLVPPVELPLVPPDEPLPDVPDEAPPLPGERSPLGLPPELPPD
jgi:hypothetical protein